VQTGTPPEVMTGPATPEVANLLMLLQDFRSAEGSKERWGNLELKV
jgi:hypothetical protein